MVLRSFPKISASFMIFQVMGAVLFILEKSLISGKYSFGGICSHLFANLNTVKTTTLGQQPPPKDSSQWDSFKIGVSCLYTGQNIQMMHRKVCCVNEFI